MAPRARHSAGQSSESVKMYNIPGFDFNEAISWRPGKAIPVADLLSRLQNLNNALRSYEEDQFDPQIFAPLATDLANANLLGHKDKGVRAWALSCVVDLLRICAPDAPFSGPSLKDIFTVFINSVLPALADPNNAYNAQHIYVLQSLSESQSIVLLADVPEPDTLITNFFTHAFDIFASSGSSGSDGEVSKSVEYHLKNLLCTVVEESDLPQDVTDVILSQFLRVDLPNSQPSKPKKQHKQDRTQSNLLLKDYPPAYNLAKAICTTCQEKMTSQISQYFNAIIVDAANASRSNSHTATSKKRFSTLEEADEEVEDLADLRKAHRLLLELWRSCPDVLINVIPQVEAELSADSPYLRQLATQTLGDMTAGIGIAGLAPTKALDPAAFPLPSVEQSEPESTTSNPLLIPASPKPFAAVYRTVYENFMSRRNDKSASVRAAWADAIARIIFTAAGGIGLSDTELSELLSGYSQMLRDQEESVRTTSLRGLAMFTYHSIVNIIGADGGLANSGSVFSTLAERFADRKHAVRIEAMSLAARLWGTASRDLEEGVETVVTVLGDMPTRLLSSYYTNDPSIHSLLDKVMYESVFPLSFPPMKTSGAQSLGQGRRTKDTEASSQEGVAPDADAVRARRILTFLRALDTRSKLVFFALQNRRGQMAKGMDVFLQACENYNGKTVKEDVDESKVKVQLKSFIEGLSKPFPDAAKISADLWKFADQNNKRDYQLIRYAMNPESDYRTMQKAIKELSKRIREGPANYQTVFDTVMQLVYRCSLVVYNRSHIPAIMAMSRTDEHGLAGAAHDLLKEISTRNPEVLKTHIEALCNELEESSPSATKAEDPGAGDTLKACAHFARKYPGEVSKDRKFLTALTNFALHSRSPKAAKHAVSIILTVADRKDMYAKEILSKALKEAKPASPNFLGQLAAIGQVCLLSATAASAETQAILKLAVVDTLQKNESSQRTEKSDAWEDLPSNGSQAKDLALKIMVNRCRSEDDQGDARQFDTTANAVLTTLMQLITNDGEIASMNDTPPAQRNHLRLTAARYILKLCSHKRRCEELVTPSMLNSIALVVINPPIAVRTGFVNQLKKYLGLNRLNHRWLTMLFLLAFEPAYELKSSTIKWLRSRVQHLERQQQQAKTTEKKVHQNVMESVFARLLSLMVHHPDYPDKDAEEFDMELLDFSKYIVFYLTAVANEHNLSLIFHIAQRIKQTKDNIVGDDSISERLYVLSDLSQAVIRNYADMMTTHTKGSNLLQTWPGQVSLPRSLFKAVSGHDAAQTIAEKNYLPEETALGLEKLIKDYVKSVKGGKQPAKRTTYAEKKRKSGSIEPDNDDEENQRTSKKRRTSLPIRKTPKSRRKSNPAPSSVQPARKSARVSTSVSYAEADSEDDEPETSAVGHGRSSPTISGATREGVRRSPKQAVAEEALEEDRHDDVPMINGASHPKADVVVHEDEDAGEDEEMGEEMSEREPTPSPLKEKENARAKKSRLKTTTTSPKQAVKEQSTRTTR